MIGNVMLPAAYLWRPSLALALPVLNLGGRSRLLFAPDSGFAEALKAKRNAAQTRA
jgi:hypothetical protein